MAFIPMVSERDRSYDIFSRMLNERIVFCTGTIEDEMASAIVAQLLILEAQDPEKDIYLYINSPGGVITAGLSIIDTMRFIKPDVSTVCIGQAASMGALILSCGTKGKRISLPNSRIMIHQPLGGAYGQASDIKIQYEEIERLKQLTNRMLAENTGQKLSVIEKKVDRDTFMSADEAMKFGLIDRVVASRSDI
jgi:Protease subunit of ATP-dependent Clp proteases